MTTHALILAGDNFLTDSKFWVLVPLVLFFVLLAVLGVFRNMGQALDARADGIRTELDEAKRLREEAQSLLASYKRKQKEAEAQAEEIVAQARRDAENMAAQSRRDLAERLERRAQAAEAKIENAEAQAIADVRSRAAELAVEQAEERLRAGLTSADQTRLIKDGLAQLGRFA